MLAWIEHVVSTRVDWLSDEDALKLSDYRDAGTDLIIAWLLMFPKDSITFHEVEVAS